MSPMPSSVLRDGVTRPGHGVVEQRGVDVEQRAVGVDVAAREQRCDERRAECRGAAA